MIYIIPFLCAAECTRVGVLHTQCAVVLGDNIIEIIAIVHQSDKINII